MDTRTNKGVPFDRLFLLKRLEMRGRKATGKGTNKERCERRKCCDLTIGKSLLLDKAEPGHDWVLASSSLPSLCCFYCPYLLLTLRRGLQFN